MFLPNKYQKPHQEIEKKTLFRKKCATPMCLLSSPINLGVFFLSKLKIAVRSVLWHGMMVLITMILQCGIAKAMLSCIPMERLS